MDGSSAGRKLFSQTLRLPNFIIFNPILILKYTTTLEDSFIKLELFINVWERNYHVFYKTNPHLFVQHFDFDNL